MGNFKSSLKVIFLIVIITSSGCDRFDTNKAKISTSQAKSPRDYAEYNGPNNVSEFDGKYHNECTHDFCILEESPVNIPIKRHDGIPLCITSQNESKALLTPYFDRDNNFIGASCEISLSDYDEILSHYGHVNVYNEYLNQYGTLEDFKNWKTKFGFITTYKELIGRGKDGRVIYIYHLYVGKNQHPNYSEYIKP